MQAHKVLLRASPSISLFSTAQVLGRGFLSHGKIPALQQGVRVWVWVCGFTKDYGWLSGQRASGLDKIPVLSRIRKSKLSLAATLRLSGEGNVQQLTEKLTLFVRLSGTFDGDSVGQLSGWLFKIPATA